MDLPTQLDQVSLPDPLPPLVITVFTRPDLLEGVLEGLLQQSLKPQQIIVYVDGPRHERDANLIQNTLALLHRFAEVLPLEIRSRSQNLGCDQNVIQAFTEVLATHEALVYLEDDDLPNPYFYDRLCRLLQAYRDHPQVFSVSAYASFPEVIQPKLEWDFEVSNRVFSWGFAIWADRWQSIDLIHKPKQYNPFGEFFQIPPTLQTKMTLTNQFWLEKNAKTDWVITLTLAALHQKRIHIIPQFSFVYNTGFGHPESETYRGAAGNWVNSRYDVNFCPQTLPPTLDLREELQQQITGIDLVKHLQKRGVWLNGSALLYFLRRYPDVGSIFAFLRLFFQHLPVLFRRWRGGLPL
jgi:glycosyltransferase involved in cell wall biosynthesis